MIIAIDGPAGSGKSTIAKEIATMTNATYLNSGKLYRAITYYFISQSVSLTEDTLQPLITSISIDFYGNGVQINEKVYDKELHTDQVDRSVPFVSSFPLVRELVNSVLLKKAGNNNVVVEGRDMTTVVFPHADYKFYLDASSEARATRRYQQGTSNLPYEELVKTIQDRDKQDQVKKVGRLQISKEAIYLDTSDLTIQEVCEKVLKSIQGNKSPQE
jgi:cytidylate kinase